jgi:hypothetical protein
MSFSSPPAAPQPSSRHRYSILGTWGGNIANPPTNEHGNSTPITSSSPSPASSSASYANCTQSILEMDRERRARREEAKKEKGAKSVLLYPSYGDTLKVEEEDEDEVSIGSPEGICSYNRTKYSNRSHPTELVLGRALLNHKRRRLCHHDHYWTTTASASAMHPSTGNKQQRSIQCSMIMTPTPKTAYSPPTMFAEIEYYYEDVFNELEYQEKESMLMPSLGDDNGHVSPTVTCLTSVMTMPLQSTEGLSHKRKTQHHQSNSPFLSATTLGSRRTSPLHFYHSQKQQQNQQQPFLDSSAGYCLTSSDSRSRVDHMECRLRPRRSFTLEEEFTRQLNFVKDNDTATAALLSLPRVYDLAQGYRNS